MKYFLLWLLLVLIWGTTWAVIRIGDGYLPPIAFCGIRFLIAGPVLLTICAALRKPILPPREMWPLLFFGGILNFTGNYGLIFWSEQYIPAGLAALIASLTPGWTMLIAHIFLPNERLSLSKLAGVFLAYVVWPLYFTTSCMLPVDWDCLVAAPCFCRHFLRPSQACGQKRKLAL